MKIFFINIWKFGEKLKVNSEVIYNKKYLKAKKVHRKRKLLIFLYASNVGWFSL